MENLPNTRRVLRIAKIVCVYRGWSDGGGERYGMKKAAASKLSACKVVNENDHLRELTEFEFKAVWGWASEIRWFIGNY